MESEKDKTEIEEIRASNLHGLLVQIPARIEVLQNQVPSLVHLDDWHRVLLADLLLSICRYSAVLAAATAAAETAWLSRNLLELWVWAEYCCTSKDNARRFYEDAMRDSNGMADAHFNICDLAKQGRELESKMRATIAAAALNHFGLESIDSDYQTVYDAAKVIGREEVYRQHNRYLSKFAHPTALMVVVVLPNADWERLQIPFTSYGAYYAHCAVEALEKLILAQSALSL